MSSPWTDTMVIQLDPAGGASPIGSVGSSSIIMRDHLLLLVDAIALELLLHDLPVLILFQDCVRLLLLLLYLLRLLLFHSLLILLLLILLLSLLLPVPRVGFSQRFFRVMQLAQVLYG